MTEKSLRESSLTWDGPVDGEATPSVRFAALGVQDLGGDSSQVIPALEFSIGTKTKILLHLTHRFARRRFRSLALRATRCAGSQIVSTLGRQAKLGASCRVQGPAG